MSPRAFFRYFASKEDVLFAEADGHCVHLLEALAEQDPVVSPFPALEAATRMVAAAYAEQRDMLRVRHRIVTSTPSLRTRAAERQQGWESELVEQFRVSGRAQRLSDLDLRLVVAATTTALRSPSKHGSPTVAPANSTRSSTPCSIASVAASIAEVEVRRLSAAAS